MTKEEFRQLQVGDCVTHPAFIGFMTVARIETTYDYSAIPPTKQTYSITTDNGRYLKIIDERDVHLLQKIQS